MDRGQFSAAINWNSTRQRRRPRHWRVEFQPIWAGIRSKSKCGPIGLRVRSDRGRFLTEIRSVSTMSSLRARWVLWVHTGPQFYLPAPQATILASKNLAEIRARSSRTLSPPTAALASGILADLGWNPIAIEPESDHGPTGSRISKAQNA